MPLTHCHSAYATTLNIKICLQNIFRYRSKIPSSCHHHFIFLYLPVINHDCSIKSERDNLFAFKAQHRRRRRCSAHTLIKFFTLQAHHHSFSLTLSSCEFVYIKIKFQLTQKKFIVRF